MEQAAIVILRKKGVSTAAKKATRVTSEGAVTSYIHAGGKIGVLLEVNCESDFVARTDDFKELAHDIAMHIAASDPKFVRKEDVTKADFDREKEIYIAQACASASRRVSPRRWSTGKMEKFYEEVCLLEQPFIKDQTISIAQLIATEDRQAGREYQRAPLRALQSRRCGRDRRRHQAYGTESGVSAGAFGRLFFASSTRAGRPRDSRRHAGATTTRYYDRSCLQTRSAEAFRRGPGC
jgi:hypothetical protein